MLNCLLSSLLPFEFCWFLHHKMWGLLLIMSFNELPFCNHKCPFFVTSNMFYLKAYFIWHWYHHFIFLMDDNCMVYLSPFFFTFKVYVSLVLKHFFFLDRIYLGLLKYPGCNILIGMLNTFTSNVTIDEVLFKYVILLFFMSHVFFCMSHSANHILLLNNYFGIQI